MTQPAGPLATLAAACLMPFAAISETWDDLRAALFADTPMLAAGDLIAIDAPRRAEDDARALIGAEVTAPGGALLSRVTVILDENPAPVSAVFTLNDPQPRFAFEATMRVNGPTPVHVVAETAAGAHYVADTFVKTSGLGACSAPPGIDADAALATLGDMEVEIQAVTAATLDQLGGDVRPGKRARVAVSHPSHSGLQMDQITLLFLPMRIVRSLEIARNDAPFLTVEGSISLSENPELAFSVPPSTHRIDVTMTDSDGTVTRATAFAPVQ